MNEKQSRQKRIIELVDREVVGTQDEIISALGRLGIKVSQSTLSKDLKELGLVKIPEPSGGFRYQLPTKSITPQRKRILEREIMDFLVDFDNAGNLLVLKTTPGNAQGVCEAIDNMGWTEILGTIAGENTILVISKTVRETKAIMKRIEGIISK